MAQVQEVSKKGLQREYAITVPLGDVEKNLSARLEEIGKKARIPGFRPGKIPMQVLRQHYGTSARAEVLDQTVSETTDKVLTDHNLRPAMQPKIELISFADNKDLEFKLAVEILPDVAVGDFTKINLERPVADVAEVTISDAITRAAKSVREAEVVTDGRSAKLGDIAVIDFDGSVDGAPQPGMQGQNHSLELGSKSFIDTFEDQIVGMKAGEKKTIKVTFPEDYHASNLSAKQAEFVVTVKELRQPKMVEMNDELAKELGFPSLEKLRERMNEDIGSNYSQVSRTIIKRHLMDKLADMHKFEVPPGMLEAEFSSIWKQVEASKTRGDLPEEDKSKGEDELRSEYMGIADRRIRLGLLLAEVAKRQKIEVAPNELRNALMNEARRFPGQEKAVVDYYTQTQGAMERLRAPLLEEKVVDHILGQANVTDKKVSSEELLKMPEQMD